MEKRVRRIAAAMAGAMLASSTGVVAQELERSSYYGAGMGGYVFHDGDYENIGYKDHALALHGVLGYRLLDNLALEFNVFGDRTRRDDEGKDYAYGTGLDLRWGLHDAGQPYYIVGLGGLYQDFYAQQSGVSPYGNIGVGILLPGFTDRHLVRAEVRWNRIIYLQDEMELFVGEDSVDEVRLNLGFQFDFTGGQNLARAPLEADADQDGVPDTRDQCPGTPPNITVTAAGCVPDLDGDGISDDRDRCPGTASGATVDVNGCPMTRDADGDGITDEMDRCPDTPQGTPIDANGCAVNTDADGDGVSDGVDQCPNTPTGYEVDERGCVVVQKVVLTGVNFALNSAKLAPQANQVLDSVAASLKLAPTLRVEVAGHTDATGSAAYNLQLSKKRAAAVRDYLIRQGVPATRLEAEGYGAAQPIADNKTEEGRTRNRRVEFRVISQ